MGRDGGDVDGCFRTFVAFCDTWDRWHPVLDAPPRVAPSVTLTSLLGEIPLIDH